MTVAAAKAPGGRPRHAVKTALLISAAVHALLLLGFVLVKTRGRLDAAVVDSRVTLPEGTFLLSLDRERAAEQKPGSGKGRSVNDIVAVRVHQRPLSPGTAEAGPAPVVDLSGMGRSTPGHGSGRRGTPGSGGGGAHFYQLPIAGKSVVYVIDRSLSMGPSGALAAARTELLASLTALPPTTRFQVVFYNTAAQTLSADQLLPITPETLREVSSAVRAVRAEGNTDHLKALRCGLALHPDILFLVTDADDLNPDQVRAITRFNKGRTLLHTVCVGPHPHGTEMLKQLAAANRGICLCPGETGRTEGK